MIFRYVVPSMLYSLEYPTNIISALHLDLFVNKISANPCLVDKFSILHLSPKLFHLIHKKNSIGIYKHKKKETLIMSLFYV